MKLNRYLPAISAVAVLVIAGAAHASTGTALDKGGATATTMVQGVGGLITVFSIGIVGALWKVYGNNILWMAAPGVGGGLITANAQAIAGQFGGGTGFDGTQLLAMAHHISTILS